MRTIGLDVGGTKVLGVVVDPAEPGVVIAERLVPTPDRGKGLVDVLSALHRDLAGIDGPAPAAIGVGVPGPVDRDGVLRMGVHLQVVRDLHLRAQLAERSGVPVAVDNDANGHALAEHRGGAAVGVDDAVVVTFGTGIGAGLIAGGRLLRGAHGYAGEPGHMVVDPNGPACPCGQRGCWERLASGTGLALLAQRAAEAGRLGAVVTRAGGRVEDVRGEHVTAAAREGDGEALVVLRELAGWMALGVANLVNLLDPTRVVLGGGLVEVVDLLIPDVRADVQRRVLAGAQGRAIEIVPAVLGERAGAIGAALLAADLLG